MSGNMSAAGATALRPTRVAPPLAAVGMLLLLLPLPLRLSSAETTHGMNSSTARFSVTMVVLPTFKVLEVTPVKGGHEYRVWTNMKSVVIKGREYRFDKIGETRLMVAGNEADGRDSLASAWQGVVGAMAATSGSAPSQATAPAGDGSNAMRVTVTY
ncbi:hypothetical protein [Variovorax paradoxus]|jgi:hypothetical protein|uniref:hypothetical protein n=1 Tax=Variovorax paradoxus TaxID=34073 RepID=UPI002480F660|nr:hypothetical protein [Variovorax paradoxus]WGT61384.1 hypothetical protein QHG62_14950 [Variovorax paradoxus]